MSELIPVLESCKNFDCPILIHCIPKKEKATFRQKKDPISSMEQAPSILKRARSKSSSKTISYTEIFCKHHDFTGRKKITIIGITAAMGSGTGIDKFSKKFPNRAYDVGIAEEHAVTMASAMALDGQKPFVAIYSTFLQRSFDQIIHDTALQNAPVVFALDRAGLVEDGPTPWVFDLYSPICE